MEIEVRCNCITLPVNISIHSKFCTLDTCIHTYIHIVEPVALHKIEESRI